MVGFDRQIAIKFEICHSLWSGLSPPRKRFFGPKRKELGLFSEIAADNRISNKAMTCLVCYTAVFSGEERCVTTLKTAV